MSRLTQKNVFVRRSSRTSGRWFLNGENGANSRPIRWQHFDNEREIKLASAAESSFGPVTRLLLYHLNSITFLQFVSAVTGIANLIPDPSFEGGGLHQIVRGGKLAIHADFNRHRNYNLDRRLNLLLYLNKDWRDEYGGHLQLWDRDMTRCEAKALPLFNRVIIAHSRCVLRRAVWRRSHSGNASSGSGLKRSVIGDMLPMTGASGFNQASLVPCTLVIPARCICI